MTLSAFGCSNLGEPGKRSWVQDRRRGRRKEQETENQGVHRNILQPHSSVVFRETQVWRSEAFSKSCYICSMVLVSPVETHQRQAFQMTVIDHKIIEHDKTLSNIKLSDLLKPNLPMSIHQHQDIYTLLWDGGVHSSPPLWWFAWIKALGAPSSRSPLT